MNYLIVVAHPDDEVLGAGATIHKLVRQGHKVAVCIMCSHADARQNLSDSLSQDEEKAMQILGVHKVYHANFPNIRMNTVPHLELVQFIEKCIMDWQAEAIFTHHPSDTNNDHIMTSYAAQAASRLFQRKSGVPTLKEFVYMEVPSPANAPTVGQAHVRARLVTEGVGAQVAQVRLRTANEAHGLTTGIHGNGVFAHQIHVRNGDNRGGVDRKSVV